MPGEFSWPQWARAAGAWFAVTVVTAYVLVKIGSLLGLRGWWPVTATLIAVTGALVFAGAMTFALSRYEKPHAGLGHLNWGLRAELSAPRHPDRAAVGPTTRPLNTAPLENGEVVTESRIRSTCDYPRCEQGAAHEDHDHP